MLRGCDDGGLTPGSITINRGCQDDRFVAFVDDIICYGYRDIITKACPVAGAKGERGIRIGKVVVGGCALGSGAGASIIHINGDCAVESDRSTANGDQVQVNIYDHCTDGLRIDATCGGRKSCFCSIVIGDRDVVVIGCAQDRNLATRVVCIDGDVEIKGFVALHASIVHDRQ